MLKNASSFVLGIIKSSTSPRGYASGFFIPAALLETFLSILAVLSRDVFDQSTRLGRRGWVGEIADIFEHPLLFEG
jgi:hypothetical protein